MSSNADRLARAVVQRRESLDVSQLTVWQAGGPSNTKLTEIENGRLEKLTASTARKLDQGLLWEPGSARRVWEGGDPVALVRRGSRRDEAWLQDRINEADISADLRRRLLAALDRGEVAG